MDYYELSQTEQNLIKGISTLDNELVATSLVALFVKKIDLKKEIILYIITGGNLRIKVDSFTYESLASRHNNKFAMNLLSTFVAEEKATRLRTFIADEKVDENVRKIAVNLLSIIEK